MEFLLSLFNVHGSIVVTALVIGIAVVIIMLLLFAQKNPEEAIKDEIGGSENVEGALRRVLGEQRWLQAGAGGGEVDPSKVGDLEKEVLEKDRTIAELNKKLTQGGGEGGGAGDDSDLMNRISELEARLQEYEIIEDDIADLSLYKTENEKLRDELKRLKGIAAGEGIPEPADDGAGVEILNSEPAPTNQEVAPEPEPAAPNVTIQTDTSGGGSPDAADLVAEFEKVVNNQEQISTDEPASSSTSVEKDGETGKVLMADEFGPKKVSEAPAEVHPKLRNVSPDSKEEAEVFIEELKNLKNLTKKEESS